MKATTGRPKGSIQALLKCNHWSEMLRSCKPDAESLEGWSLLGLGLVEHIQPVTFRNRSLDCYLGE